jgi:hypothetical protein
MPPSEGRAVAWWERQWAELQTWSSYLSLSFPDYSPEGLLFSMDPEGGVSHAVGFSEDLFVTDLWMVLQTLTPSAPLDWGEMAAKSMRIYLESREPEARPTLQEYLERREHTLTHNLEALGEAVDHDHMEIIRRVDNQEGGISFARWPTDVPKSGGICTIWWGEKEVIWVATATNLFETLDACVHGGPAGSEFRAAAYDRYIHPHLNDAARRGLAQGTLPVEKMITYWVRRNLSYSSTRIDDAPTAQRIARLIRAGVLNAGAPQLNPSDDRRSQPPPPADHATASGGASTS